MQAFLFTETIQLQQTNNFQYKQFTFTNASRNKHF